MQNEIRGLLTDTLKLGERGLRLTGDSGLLGTIPELDSMAVVTIVVLLEEHYEIEFDDDDITAESFATLSSLTALVERKLAA